MKMSFWKRLLECILAAVLMILLSAGSARPVSAEETGGQEKIKAGDILCFGTPDEACAKEMSVSESPAPACCIADTRDATSPSFAE